VLARSDARRAAGRYPLVLFAHASVETESVMAEYLASYGYVVAGVRSRGAVDADYRLTRANLDAVTLDLDVAASHMKHEPNVRTGNIAVIGMSNGAIAAVALQLERHDIGAIVSLDGTIGENAGGVYLAEKSSGDAAKFSAPILHVYTPDNEFLNLEHLRGFGASPRLLVAIPELRHRDFLAYAAFDRAVPEFSGASFSARAHTGFVWVNRYALHFIDAFLRSSRHGAAFLQAEPTAQGVPSDLLQVERLR
jgi:predicted esterase